jgi:hypothetical protein
MNWGGESGWRCGDRAAWQRCGEGRGVSRAHWRREAGQEAPEKRRADGEHSGWRALDAPKQGKLTNKAGDSRGPRTRPPSAAPTRDRPALYPATPSENDCDRRSAARKAGHQATAACAAPAPREKNAHRDDVADSQHCQVLDGGTLKAEKRAMRRATEGRRGVGCVSLVLSDPSNLPRRPALSWMTAEAPPHRARRQMSCGAWGDAASRRSRSRAPNTSPTAPRMYAASVDSSVDRRPLEFSSWSNQPMS